MTHCNPNDSAPPLLRRGGQGVRLKNQHLRTALWPPLSGSAGEGSERFSAPGVGYAPGVRFAPGATWVMYVRFAAVLGLLLAITPTAFAQEVTQNVEQQLENIAEATEAEPEDDLLLQQLQYFRRRPLDLNSATPDDLRQLKLLTEGQIAQWERYRNRLGSFVSIYELQAIPGWDLLTIRRVLPYLSLSPAQNAATSLWARFRGGDHTLLLRESRTLEAQRGFADSLANGFAGSPDHLLLRYRYVYKNELQWGFTADKDPGEALFKGTRKSGFDFYSAHLFIRRLGRIKALALGDYSVNLGQGLVQWGSLAFRKSADVINVKRQSATLLPFNSAQEALFHRGVGISVEQGGWEATAFFSRKKISGNSGIDTATGEDIFTSFQLGGLHRTPSEIADRYGVGQTAFGGALHYRRGGFRIGGNAIRYLFSQPLQKRSEPYNAFAPSGNRWHNASLDWSGTWRNLHFFGEAALDPQGNKAFVNGLEMSLHPAADFSLLHRKIDPGYAAIAGNAFTEATQPTNETGLYTGLRLRPRDGWQLDAYADHYRFPFIRYRADAPGAGRDYLLQLTHKPSKVLELYARYRWEEKPGNPSGVDTVLYPQVLKRRSNLRLHGAYTLSRSWAFRGRAEAVRTGADDCKAEQGYLFFAQVDYDRGFDFSANARLAWFSTGGYDSRIYAYESDVLYSYSIPPLFGKGLRYYLNLRWDAGKKLSFWLRWAQTVYREADTIGSGLLEIAGNKRSDLRLQARFSF